MNRGQLARALAKTFSLPQAQAEGILAFLIDQVGQALRRRERLFLRDLGAFTRGVRAAKRVRHPKTGRLIKIPPRPDVRVNPARALLRALR